MQSYKLTSTQKAVAISALLGAACVSLLIVSNAPQPTTEMSQAEKVISTIAPPENQIVTFAPADIPPVASAQMMPEQKTKLPAPAVENKSWQMANVKAATPKIPLSEKISQYAIVQLEQHPAQFPAVGEQVQLPMLNGQSLMAIVQSTTSNPNGDYTWSGHLQGHGDDYPVVMTYGEHSIFATITTPDGSYTMESLDGLGWLYKNPAEIELSNPGAKDFLDVTEAQ